MAARILPCLIALTFVLSSTGPLTATQPPQQSPISPAAAVPTQDAVSQAIRGNPVLFCENVAQFAGYTRVQSSNGPESIPPYALSSSYDDEFNGPNLNPRWSWFNEDPSRWSLIASSGYIRIVGTTGDMWQSCGNPPKNLLLQEAPTGDFQIWTKLSLHPTINYQSGGLLIFQDLDNYIKLDVLWNNTTQNGESAEFIREQHGASSWPWPWFNVNLSQPAFLKITRSGNTYNGYYGSDGQQWRLVGTITASTITTPKIGIFTLTTCAGSVPDIPVDFDFVRLNCTTGCPSIAGRVTDIAGNSLADVSISASAGGSTTTGSNGDYVLSGLTAGTYTLTPSKSGYSFTPTRRTITVSGNVTGQDFRGVADGGPPTPFLDLPFVYDRSETAFIQMLKNWNAGGKVTSWFDHKYPDGGHGGVEGIWVYKGAPLTQEPEPQSSTVLCYDGYCYDGHNGIDFAPSTTAIRPAASGIVVDAKIDCQVGDYSCGGGYGNHVVVDHGNGYFTRYAHLKEVYKSTGQPVTVNDTLGIMGNTGNSTGIHLHFGLYRDSNGNGSWDAGTDKVVDPYGWKRDVADPWVVDRQGPTSYRLWLRDPDRQMTFAGSQGAVVSNPIGSAIANVPPGAISGQATVELSPGPVAGASAQLRTAGQSFWLRLLEWLPGSSDQVSAAAASPEGTAAFTLTQPITLTVAYSDTDVLHLDVSQFALRLWDEGQGAWQPLSTVVDPVRRVVTATSQYLGDFDLQAPLLCATDALEPDDGYPAATPVWPNDPSLARGLDITQDSDWLRFHAAQGWQYTLRTLDLAGGADTVLNLYDVDGLTLLASNDNAGSGSASELIWTAPYTGTYFVEVVSAPGGVTSCAATYRLSITTTASLIVTGTHKPGGLTLTWPHDPQYAGYQVRRTTTPYFAARDWSESPADLPAPVSQSEASYTDPDAFVSGTSYFYAVLPTDSDGQPYLVSNRTGVFNFALTPGGN